MTAQSARFVSAGKGARSYFDKITEELVDPDKLVSSGIPFVSAIGSAYKRYAATLLGNNRLDIAHQQKLVFELLSDPAIGDSVSSGVKYLMVDEY